MRQLFAAAVFFIGAAVALAQPLPADDDLHLVRLRKDGTHAVAKLPLTSEQIADTKQLWAWTDQLPPQRIDALKGAAPGAIVAQLRHAQPHSVDVRLRGWKRPEDLGALRVVAAPPEMWSKVPEPLLPSVGVSKEGRASIVAAGDVRVRVVGDGFATMWQGVPRSARSADIALRRPAADAKISFRLSDATAAARIFTLVMSRRSGDAEGAVQARFASDEKGSLLIRSLPESEIITLFVSGPRCAPQLISGTAAELSRTITLPAAAHLRGRWVDEKNRPLAGVRIVGEGWVSPDAPAVSRDGGVSDASGAWSVDNLPRADVVMRATAPDRAAFRKRVSLQDGDVDLGTIPLVRATPLVVSVSDQSQQPVPNVSVESDSGLHARTGAKGSASLAGLPADSETAITFTAAGFLKKTIHVAPPFAKEEHVVLDRSFVVRGRVVAEDGRAAGSVTAVVAAGAKYRDEHVDADGTFSFDVEPEKEFDLTFETPYTASVSRTEPAGRAGEVRDLGTIRLPSGRSVIGRVVDASNSAVAGARIWAVRPSAGGVVTAWADGRVVETISDSTGAFDLRGLAEGPAPLRIDAADFSLDYWDVVTDENRVDLGPITLNRGRTAVVK